MRSDIQENMMDERLPEKTSGPSSSNILVAAHTFVLQFYNLKQDAQFVFHHYQNAVSIVKQLQEYLKAGQITGPAAEIAQLAAWFMQVGYLINYQDPTRASYMEARRFLHQNQYPEDRTDRVLHVIQTVGSQAAPKIQEDQWVADAVQVVEHIKDFPERSPLLRLEREFKLGETERKINWQESEMQRLLNVKLYTHYAKSKFEPILASHIHQHKKLLDKASTGLPDVVQSEGITRNFADLERKQPLRAIQTYFRTNYRNHINLSAIADNKANIMISVNSILISVLITFLSYQNIAQTKPIILLPVVIFLVAALASLIFAVLSARPKVTRLNDTQVPFEQAKRNVTFFGNFVNLELPDFEEAMDAVFRDSELLYGNMVRDLYYLGKVLDKKYRFLTISYNIFMVGFVVTVFTYLITLLF